MGPNECPFFFQVILHWSAFLLAFECAHAAHTQTHFQTERKNNKESKVQRKFKQKVEETFEYKEPRLILSKL